MQGDSAWKSHVFPTGLMKFKNYATRWLCYYNSERASVGLGEIIPARTEINGVVVTGWTRPGKK